jgi:hypothetical protein
MEKELPVFSIHISDNENGEEEVDFVSLVSTPAVQKNFLRFKEDQPGIKIQSRQRFEIQDEEERIVSGVLMLADFPIYRNNESFGEHYVVFSKDEIKKIVQRFFKKGYQGNVNLEHDKPVDGVFMFESLIVEPEKGKNAFKGFEDVNPGSWLGSFKVDNPETWEDVKSGKFKGFSIEGLFEYRSKEKTKEEQLLSEIEKILSKVEQ